jgi:phosphomevalonate kinase
MKKNLITIVLIIIIGVVAFMYLNRSSSSDALLSTDVATTDSADAKYIYNILQQMKKVELNDSIFSNSVFQGLKENVINFSPQESGRVNPFSPISNN